MQDNQRMNGRIPQRQQQGGDQRQRIGDAPRRHNLLQQQQGMLNIPPAVDRRQGNQVRRGDQNPPGLQGGLHGQQARGADIQRQNAGIPQQPQPANANVQGPQQPQYRPQQNAVVAGVNKRKEHIIKDKMLVYLNSLNRPMQMFKGFNNPSIDLNKMLVYLNSLYRPMQMFKGGTNPSVYLSRGTTRFQATGLISTSGLLRGWPLLCRDMGTSEHLQLFRHEPTLVTHTRKFRDPAFDMIQVWL